MPAARPSALSQYVHRLVTWPWRAAAACLLLAGGVGLDAGRGAPPAGEEEPPPGGLARAGTTRFRHGSVVTSLSFSRDGKVLASAGWDATVRLWGPGTGEELCTVELPTKVLCAALSPDGKVVFSAGADRVVRLSDAKAGRQLWAVAAHTSQISSVAFTPDGKIAVSAAESLRLWDVATGTQRKALIGGGSAVSAVAFSPDGKLMASADEASTAPDGTARWAVRLWVTSSGRLLASLGGHPAPVLAVAFSPDGKRLAAGAGNVVRLWDVPGRKELRVLAGHGGTVTSVAFAPDGKTLASATGRPKGDGSARLWDVESGRELRRFPVGFLGTVAFAPDGKALAVAAGDAAVRLYDPATGRELPQSAGRVVRAQCLACSPDGRLVAAVGADIVLLDAATGRQVRHLGSPALGTYAAAFTPDGRTLATGGRDGVVRLWEVATGKEVRSLDRHKAGGTDKGWISGLAFAPAGSTLAEASRDGTAALWDVAAGTLGYRFRGYEGPVWSVAFGPGGKTLVTGGGDRLAHLWDAGTGGELRQTARHQAEVEGVAYSPDARLVASAGRDGKVTLCSAATGEAVRVLEEPDGWRRRLDHHRDGRAVAFSPDGRLLAWGSWRSAHLTEVATGKERARFVGHRGEVSALAFTPDGRTLVTSSFDGCTVFWDVTGRRVAGAAAKPSPEDLRRAWADLRGEDGPRAHRAVWALAADPEGALPLLKGQLKPAAAADDKRIARLIAELDDDNFAVREKATEELGKLPGAGPALRKALEGAAGAEVRQRLAAALKEQERAGASPDWVGTLRAVEALERMATPEAREWLRELAKGAPGAPLTQEAKAALARLDKARP
jgi:WD40 repeat protein